MELDRIAVLADLESIRADIDTVATAAADATCHNAQA